MLTEFLIVILGCVVVVLLAHLIIKKNIDIAEHFGFSGTFVGMTILSIGTSLPEILTALAGSIQILKDTSLMNTVSGLVLGTSIGSDIFQQNFILAIVAILGTVVLVKKHLWPIMGGLMGGTAVLLILGLNGIISRWEGLVLVGGYLLYLVYLNRRGLNDHVRARKHLDGKGLVFTILLLLVSFGVIALVANRVLKASEVLVEVLPISASFFGIIIIGIAAALPELTTALVALKKRRKGMSIGVLIGSNITNPTFALGLGAMVSTYVVPNVVIWYDLPVKILSSLVILGFLWKYKHLGKREAVILIGMFLVYLIIRSIFFPVDF